jgi:hypothetical protein
MNTDKAREFLQTNSPTLYDWLFDKDMPAGIDDMICLVMEQYDNRDKWISVKNPPKEFEEVLIAYKYNSVPVQAYLKMEYGWVVMRLRNIFWMYLLMIEN